MEGYWDVVVSSLQDICNDNEKLSFDPINEVDTILSPPANSAPTSYADLQKQRTEFVNHKQNLEKSARLLDTILINVNGLISQLDERTTDSGLDGSSSGSYTGIETTPSLPNMKIGKRSSVSAATAASAAQQNSSLSSSGSAKGGKVGRSYYTSQFNPSEPITLGSEVAFKRRQKDSDWILCKVVKVFSETRFEVQDTEPDDNVTQDVFKATWKDLILIPPAAQLNKINNYPTGTRVLARYPETTTFYPAEVMGFKRDGTCRLRFEGEEEEGKETEVERRFVVPYPG